MIEMFLSRQKSIYRFFFKYFYDELSDEQLRCRPHPQVNTLVWVLWHTARSEDIGVNRLVTDGVQVADEGNWLERMKVPWRHFGIGMTFEEVEELSQTIDLDALSTYHEAVGKRTAQVAESLTPEYLNQTLDRESLKQTLLGEKLVRPDSTVVVDSYAGMTRGWLLIHLGLTHPYTHIGEATTIASLMGFHRF